MDSINMMNNMQSFRNNEHIKYNQTEPSNNIDDKVVLSNNESDKNLYDKDSNSSMIKRNIFPNQNLIIKSPANKIDHESEKYNGAISSGFTFRNQQDNNIQNVNNSHVYVQSISPEPVTSLHNNQDYSHKDENRKSSNKIQNEICWDDAHNSSFGTVPKSTNSNEWILVGKNKNQENYLQKRWNKRITSEVTGTKHDACVSFKAADRVVDVFVGKVDKNVDASNIVSLFKKHLILM